MFNSLPFQYSKNNKNAKKNIIIKQQESFHNFTENDKKLLKESISFTNKLKNNNINLHNFVSENQNQNQNDSNPNYESDNKINFNINLINKNLVFNHNNDSIMDQLLFENKLIINNSDITNTNVMEPFNINLLLKKGIKYINNVYQSNYKPNANSTGLGDFIRGSYFLLELCDFYPFLKPKIIFNNCISNYLKIKTKELHRLTNVLKNITFMSNNNLIECNISNDKYILNPIKNNKTIMHDVVDYMKSLPVYNGNIFIYCISYPMGEVSEKNKSYMKNLLEPTDDLKLEITTILQDLCLERKQYIVIHIRSGDSYLSGGNKIFKKDYLDNLINNINQVKSEEKESNCNYLLIADNNEIKILLVNIFPDLKILVRNITHFGEGTILEQHKVKNTLIDFYLLSFSKKIFAFSCYEHGSGFSYWCAKTFDIPYSCKFIK